MDITSSVARRISQFAWVMAAAGTVIGQVHALARAQAHPGGLRGVTTGPGVGRAGHQRC